MPMMTATAAMIRGSPSGRCGQPEQLVEQAAGAFGAVQVLEAAREVQERRDRAQDRGYACGDVERPVDRGQAALGGPWPAQVHTDDGGQCADRRDDEREHQALRPERDRAEDQRRDQRDRVGLEQVGGHAGAVADVVTDVVRDRGGVAGVVLGDVVLDLADQVGADIGRLGEDAAADTHEHRQQRGAEAEALQDRRGVALVDQHDSGGAEQSESDGGHADGATGAECDPHRGVTTLVTRGRRDADVGAYGEPHAHVADGGGEAGAHQEEQRPADPDADVAREHEQQRERHHGEDRERLELARQVGRGALLDGLADGLHVLCAFVGSQHLAAEHPRHRDRNHSDHGDDDDKGDVAAGQRHIRTG